MQKELTARPTEYRGIQYRSKCEAMFARYLTLREDGFTGGYQYEPEGLQMFLQWIPDFVVFRMVTNSYSLAGLPCLDYQVIEYKPSEPTGTYTTEWAANCKTLFEAWENRGWLDVAYRSSFALYFGSVFNQDRGIFYCGPDAGWKAQRYQQDWLSHYEKEVKATRFDLKAEVPHGR